MHNLRTPEHTLFERIELLNINIESKKEIQLLIKPKIDGLVYFTKKNGLTINAFVDPNDGTLVVPESIKTGRPSINPHQRYHELAYDYAIEMFNKWCNNYEKMSSEDKSKYKPLFSIKAAVYNWFDVNIFKFYQDLHKKLSSLPVLQLPLYNEYIRYENEDYNINRLTSVTMPYGNPKGLLTKDVSHVDKFMNVFFEEEDKRIFSWYMGAVMSNIELQDENVTKLLFVHGKPGCGKSSLTLGLGTEMLSKEMIHIASDFDSYFAANNKFANGDVSSKRLSIYNESRWGFKERQDLPHEHNFTGLNMNAIQTLISDGYIDSERKYEHKETSIKSGLHIILTNHIPRIKDEDLAMNRRLLPCVMKSTSMFEKVQELNLEGNKFREYIRKNAVDFAIYFVKAFNDYKTEYRNYVYDHNDYIEMMDDDKIIRENEQAKTREVIEKAAKTNVGEFFKELDNYGFDIDTLRVDIERNSDNAKIQGDKLYINSSRIYFTSFSNKGDSVREFFINVFGKPVKKFGKRMFVLDAVGYKDLISVLKDRSENNKSKLVNEIKEVILNYKRNKKNLVDIFPENVVVEILGEIFEKAEYSLSNIPKLDDENVFLVK